jgi:predicted DNA-binding protein with PD1-like motif
MFLGKLPNGSDLLRELNRFAAANEIKGGVVQVMGSLGRARLSFYDQKLHAYKELDFDDSHEIVSGSGNISMRDDKPVVHLHLAVADSQGRVLGGHCLEGCRVFAVEFAIWPLKGKAPRRAPDNATGLLLWEDEVYSDES